MNIQQLVIDQIKQILITNRVNICDYKFHKKSSSICIRQKCKHVKIDLSLFSQNQVTENAPDYNAYLREKINQLFDMVDRPTIQCNKKGIIVLVHGAWHTGPLLRKTVDILKKNGWAVYAPTIKGNKPGDNRETINLTDAIQSVVDHIVGLDLKDVVLVGHSYGGMVITGVVDRIMSRIKRLVYWNAFVPLNGQALIDMTPPSYNQLFQQLADQNNNAVLIPFPIWREVFINYGDTKMADETWNSLNPHPYLTFTENLVFQNFSELSALNIGKSYINGLADVALPASQGWHPRLSERLGLYRYIDHPYDHEVCFTYPDVLARCIDQAARD